MPTIHIIFHASDFDGQCAGAIAGQYMQETQPAATMHWHPMNYGDQLDTSNLHEGDTVVIVDFSFHPDTMRDMHNRFHLIWIDHHKTAIDAANVAGLDEIMGVREIGTAACELTWEYFYSVLELPSAVRLLGRYDVWDHNSTYNWDDCIYPFQMGMRQFANTDPSTEEGRAFWKKALSYTLDECRDIIKDGNAIMRYEVVQATRAMKNAYEVDWNGLRALVVNRGGNSTTFASRYDPDKHDLCVGFTRTEVRQYRLSIYSSKPNISAGSIAKLYGGGGHDGAAGCTVNTLPWEEQNETLSHPRDAASA